MPKPRKTTNTPSTAAIDIDGVELAIKRALPNATAQQHAALFGRVLMGSGVLAQQISPTARKARLKAIEEAARLLASELVPPMPALRRHLEGNTESEANNLALVDLVRTRNALNLVALAADKAHRAMRVSRGGQSVGEALQFTVKLVLAWNDAFGEVPRATRKGPFALFHEAACKAVHLHVPDDSFRLIQSAIRIAHSALNQ